VCLRVLLNLALSAPTARAVTAHRGLRDGLKSALADVENLSKAARQLIEDVGFQLNMTDGSGVSDAIERVRAASAGSRHFMLSYCWAQQEVVMRIRRELGRRSYDVWVDTEQMQGSTVDAMADAIDRAVAVIYGVSLECEMLPLLRMLPVISRGAPP
jgi:hypothetical protein